MTFGGPGGGGYPPGYDPASQLRTDIAYLRQEFDRKLNNVGQHIRKRDEALDSASRRLGEMSAALEVLRSTRVGIDDTPGVVRIENIPGRRVPFTFLVDIPIGSNTTSVQQGSLTISQEGPFVAVRRIATFQSAYEFQVNPVGEIVTSPARYSGRSFGRFRPVHSAWDLLDSGIPNLLSLNFFAAAGGLPPSAGMYSNGSIPATPANSGFRSMEFDGRIAVINAGSSYPRQNIPVPTTFWSSSINSPYDLGCLDFFERGEVITFQVAPTHVNNPNAGNANGANMFKSQGPFGTSVGWPFLDGQFDAHEGIVTPGAIDVPNEGDAATLVSDPIVRLPDGILTIGFEGYRIIQPVAP